jgi:hypothetical protein
MAPFPHLNGVLLINTDNICSKSVMSLYLSILIPRSMSLVLLWEIYGTISSIPCLGGRLSKVQDNPSGQLTVPRMQSSLHGKSRYMLYL